MKKLLLISAYSASFVNADHKLLSQHYNVTRIGVLPKRRNYMQYFLLIFSIGWAVLHNDIIFCWFSDYRARIAVFFARLFGKKSLVIVGGYELQDYKNDSDNLMNVKPGRHLRFCLKYANAIIAVSDFYRKRLENLAFGKKCELFTVYNAIKPPQFHGVINKKNMVITVCSGDDPGRISVKGLDIFLQVAALIPKTEFVIIGPENGLYKALLKEINSPNVSIIGNLNKEELLKYYFDAKVYCQFSRYESFGLSLVEAMACQCLPVVSDIPALRERVDNYGQIMKEWNAEMGAKLVKNALVIENDSGEKIAKWVNSTFNLKKREEELLNILAKWE